jgi:transcriptional regulator with XRE-family HTH domain
MSREVVAITFGRVLKRLREQRGLSQEELAGDEGDRTHPSLLERGRRTPSLATIYKLSDKLAIKPAELVRAAHVEYRASLERAEKLRAGIEKNRGKSRPRKPNPSDTFGGKANRELAARAFGYILRTTRIEQNLTGSELAALSGIEADYVSLVERGLRTPSIAIIRRLASGLGMHADQLIERAYERLNLLQNASAPAQHRGKDMDQEVRPFWRTDT